VRAQQSAGAPPTSAADLRHQQDASASNDPDPGRYQVERAAEVAGEGVLGGEGVQGFLTQTTDRELLESTKDLLELVKELESQNLNSKRVKSQANELVERASDETRRTLTDTPEARMAGFLRELGYTEAPKPAGPGSPGPPVRQRQSAATADLKQAQQPIETLVIRVRPQELRRSENFQANGAFRADSTEPLVRVVRVRRSELRRWQESLQEQALEAHRVWPRPPVADAEDEAAGNKTGAVAGRRDAQQLQSRAKSVTQAVNDDRIGDTEEQLAELADEWLRVIVIAAPGSPLPKSAPAADAGTKPPATAEQAADGGVEDGR